MRGFDTPAEIEHVEEHIKRQCPQIIKVIKMRTQNRPLYLVITDHTVTVETIRAKVLVIMHVRVTFASAP